MQARLILGPAGSGKTFRCLAEIRAALADAPDGPPLLLIAPKQTTYQLERQLLADPSLAGYTRLRILSFERLAFFILEQLQKPSPRLLTEEGRLMVLRALLAKKRNELKLFRASARLTGFAQHLSLALRELQRCQLTPASLHKLAREARAVEGLSFKLHDLATLLEDYLEWLQSHRLQDAEHLLDFAAETLRGPHAPLTLDQVWVDGFTEMSAQELDLLGEVVSLAPNATITFCLDRIPTETISWLSTWSAVRQMYQQCGARLAGLPNCKVSIELLNRPGDRKQKETPLPNPLPARSSRGEGEDQHTSTSGLPLRSEQGRFANNSVLFHIEKNWAEPKPFRRATGTGKDALNLALRVAICANPEAELTLAAREILGFVRAGGRYREVTVLARGLEPYHATLVNVFTRYEIPFFLDRREAVSHHPLAELTRNALRTVAFTWQRNDWFAALKTGLVPAGETDIDRLENEALARGWQGSAWLQPIAIPDDPALARSLEEVRLKVIPAFNKLAMSLGSYGNRPTGKQLAGALREFWQRLNVEETLQRWSTETAEPRPIHLTVWEQMGAWLDNVELAFPAEALPLREWLPILDAGLAGLTVGVIPPALDQVFVGTIDRSRNPDIRLAIILGMNEGLFPAVPQPSVLLTDADRVELEKQGVALATARGQLGRERFYAYVACTRARERLVLTCSAADADGRLLNLSPFLSPLKQLFPALEFETVPRTFDWQQSEHAGELIVPLLRNQSRSSSSVAEALDRLSDLPALAPLRESLRHLVAPKAEESLAPALVAQLYGADLRTSVSRMEQFAACPFKFFVHSGLRAEERKSFELDIREQGNFQHEVLASFHEQLQQEGKRWRDITPAEARDRIKAIATGKVVSFRDGLLQSTEESKFTARVMTASLQDFVETLVGWMHSQYAFDPAAVELPFGDDDDRFPAWQLDLGDGHRLMLRGRIDRIDICPEPGGDQALCVVVDYKSSEKQLDSLMMEHGLQLQLPAYLSVLRHWPNPKPIFGVARLLPAGVFYVNLRGKYERGHTRDEVLMDVENVRKLAYQHSGRFDAQQLRKLDQRPDAKAGDQFNYRLNKDGSISANSREAMKPEEFTALLDRLEEGLKKMGRGVFAGVAKVDPYRKGTVTACELCDYASICRIDPWTHTNRVLRRAVQEEET